MISPKTKKCLLTAGVILCGIGSSIAQNSLPLPKSNDVDSLTSQVLDRLEISIENCVYTPCVDAPKSLSCTNFIDPNNLKIMRRINLPEFGGDEGGSCPQFNDIDDFSFQCCDLVVKVKQESE